MKQPVITRDLERKAIYTDIVYDPEWTYVEVNVKDYKQHTLNISSSVIVDWGDGTIDKETEHMYDWHIDRDRVIVRVKGDIKPEIEKRSPFDKYVMTKALQIGKYVTSCNSMFNGCTHLTEVSPNIFQYATQVTDCSYMFANCEKIKNINGPLFPDNCQVEDVRYMFSQCTSLRTIPAGLFSGLKHLTNASSAFLSCYNFETNIDGMFDGCVNLVNVAKCFEDCCVLHSPNRDMFKGCINLQNVNSLFNTNSTFGKDTTKNFNNIPEDLFSDCPNIKTADCVFWNRQNITHIPAQLFSKCKDLKQTAFMFSMCDDLDEESMKLAKENNWI